MQVRIFMMALLSDSHAGFIYLFEGEGRFLTDNQDEPHLIQAPKLLVLGHGDLLKITSGEKLCRCLIVSGQPLNEPIARYGPFVMNTREEIGQTLHQLQNGTFIR